MAAAHVTRAPEVPVLIATQPAFAVPARIRISERQAACLVLFAIVLLLLLPSVIPGPDLGVAVAVVCPMMLPWIYQQPVRSLYLIVGSALLIEIFGLGFPDSLTDRVPLFLNLNSSNQALPPISPAEVLMSCALVAWLAKGRALFEKEVLRSPLFQAFAVFMAVVALAELEGLARGGDFLTSLWELRPQLYAFLLFVLTASFVRTLDDIRRLTTVFALCVAAKTVIGLWRYFVTLQGDLGGREAILSHEDSYFLALLLVGILGMVIWTPSRRRIGWAALLGPAALLTLLENHRRAGTTALMVGLAVVLALAIQAEPARRKQLVAIALAGLAATAAFAAAYWDHPNGIIGELLRPLHSLAGDPDPRDQLSNLYRDNENLNILVTFRDSPLTGFGFGRKFLIVAPLADISSIFPLWNVIPHNTVLWVLMRTGIIGFAAFWGMIGLFVHTGVRHLRSSISPQVRLLAAFAVAAIIAEIVVAYTDLQLENYRNMIFLGACMGIIAALPRLEQKAAPDARRASGDA